MIRTEDEGPVTSAAGAAGKALESYFLANRLALLSSIAAGPNFKKLGKIVSY
jgi:hypothetical protein